MTLGDVVDFSYDMRGSEVNEIKKKKKRSNKAEDDYDKVAHYMGRLGATQWSVLAIVRGMIKVPALRQISCIRTAETPDIRTVTLDQWAMSPYEILRGICLDLVSQIPPQNRTLSWSFRGTEMQGDNFRVSAVTTHVACRATCLGQS